MGGWESYYESRGTGRFRVSTTRGPAATQASVAEMVNLAWPLSVLHLTDLQSGDRGCFATRIALWSCSRSEIEGILLSLCLASHIN